MCFYQTEHFLIGLMLDPDGQLKSFANSRLLDKGPFIRNLTGACSSLIYNSMSCGVVFLHHKFA